MVNENKRNAEVSGEDSIRDRIQLLAAENPNCPDDITELFATKGTAETKLVLVGKPNISKKALKILAKDRNEEISEKAWARFEVVEK